MQAIHVRRLKIVVDAASPSVDKHLSQCVYSPAVSSGELHGSFLREVWG